MDTGTEVRPCSHGESYSSLGSLSIVGWGEVLTPISPRRLFNALVWTWLLYLTPGLRALGQLTPCPEREFYANLGRRTLHELYQAKLQFNGMYSMRQGAVRPYPGPVKGFKRRV